MVWVVGMVIAAPCLMFHALGSRVGSGLSEARNLGARYILLAMRAPAAFVLLKKKTEGARPNVASVRAP